MSNQLNPIIVCAAIKYLMLDPKDDVIVTGARHYDLLMHTIVRSLDLRKRCIKEIQGFVDQYGNFYNRTAALTVAQVAGQIDKHRPKTNPKHLLFSEDLY